MEEFISILPLLKVYLWVSIISTGLLWFVIVVGVLIKGSEKK